MDDIEKRHIKVLASVLEQDLDDYGLEITACYALEGMCYNTLTEMRKRTTRFLEALNKIIEEE